MSEKQLIALIIAVLFLAFAMGMLVQYKTHEPKGADMNGDGKVDIVDWSIADGIALKIMSQLQDNQ